MKYNFFSILKTGALAIFLSLSLAGCAQNNKSAGLDSANPQTETSADQTQDQVAEQSVPQQTGPKKVSILGDSYSTFAGWLSSPENLAWYKPVPKKGRATDVTDVNQTWWKIFIDEHGYEFEKNNSYSGSTICNTGYGGKDYTDQSFVTRLTDLGDPDMILVFGGTNDSWADAPLGEYVYSDWTPKQLYSIRPATAYMLSELKRLHPKAEIVVLINDLQKPEVTESLIEISNHYGVPYVALQGIDKMSDHPSQLGMRQIVDQLNDVLAKK